MAEVPKGYLVITVLEADGKNKEDAYLWDSTPFEGFVKVELRGGARNIKVQTRKVPLSGTSLEWTEDLVLEVLEGSNELRLMLCREKLTGGRKGTSVIAACGIYVNEIIDAVPIDKFFELFKPQNGGQGGYIRVGLNFVKDAHDLPAGNAKRPSSTTTSVPSSAVVEPQRTPAATPTGAVGPRTMRDLDDNRSWGSVDSPAPDGGSSVRGVADRSAAAAGPEANGGQDAQSGRKPDKKKKKKGGVLLPLLLLTAAAGAAAGFVLRKQGRI